MGPAGLAVKAGLRPTRALGGEEAPELLDRLIVGAVMEANRDRMSAGTFAASLASSPTSARGRLDTHVEGFERVPSSSRP